MIVTLSGPSWISMARLGVCALVPLALIPSSTLWLMCAPDPPAWTITPQAPLSVETASENEKPSEATLGAESEREPLTRVSDASLAVRPQERSPINDARRESDFIIAMF